MVSIGAMLAIGAVIVGITLTWASWRAVRSRAWLAAAGALIMIASGLLWAEPSGIEQRVALSLLAAMLGALAVLGVVAVRSRPRGLPVRTRNVGRPTPAPRRRADAPQALVLGLAQCAISGLSALALCAGLFALLRASGAEASAIVAGTMLLFPLSWGLLVGLCAGQAEKRAATIMLAPGLVGATAMALF